MVKIGSGELDVSRLCLGGNVFGWTADRDTSFAVLDAYVAAGGNFVDTADSYMWRVPATPAASPRRSSATGWRRAATATTVVVATKVGSLPSRAGSSAANIRAAVRGLAAPPAHRPDRPLLRPQRRPGHPAGGDPRRVRRAGARGQGARVGRLELLRRAAARRRWRSRARDGLAPYVALQPHYNLLERARVRGRAARRCWTPKGWPACRTTGWPRAS